MKNFILLLTIAYGIENAFAQSPSTQSSSTADILDRILGQGYDWRVRPVPPRGGPTHINVNTYLRRIKPIDDGLEVEVTFRQNWNDSRLSYARDFRDAPPFIVIHPLDKSNRRIWMPDTFFQNAYDIQMQGIPSPNELLRVYGTGEVLSSQKISMKLACPMDYANYPSDQQKCNMDFASYAYTTDDIVYDWKTDNPVQQKDNLGTTLANYKLEPTQTSTCTSKTNTGEYACLRAVMSLRRENNGKSAKLYIIPLLLVILSWLPFIINAQSIIVRVLIGFFCLSTLILHSSIIGAELPKVGYATGADIWLTRCLGFIAATLIQLIFYVWIVRATTAHKERRLAKIRATKDKLFIDRDEVVLVRTDPVYKEDRSMGISLLVDLISLAIFMLAFFVFLIHYFTKY